MDKLLNNTSYRAIGSKISEILNNTEYESTVDSGLIRQNFDQYWHRMDKAGVFWWTDKDRRLDNHTHNLHIFNSQTNANSNQFLSLHRDLQIMEVLKEVINDIDISLNSFSKNLHKALYPTRYHPQIEANRHLLLGSYIISAKIPNAIDKNGPNPEIFDKIYDNSFVREFRAFISDQKFEDAEEVYKDVINEIDDSVKQHIRKTVRNARPVNGLVNIAIESAIDYSGLGAVKNFGGLYLSVINPSPTGAAAFLYDLE